MITGEPDKLGWREGKGGKGVREAGEEKEEEAMRGEHQAPRGRHHPAEPSPSATTCCSAHVLM